MPSAESSNSDRAAKVVNRKLNRNIIILGSASLLALGVILFVIASKIGGDKVLIDQEVTSRLTENEYFQGLVENGTASRADLSEIERAFPYGDRYIGVTRRSYTGSEARELALRTGARLLDPLVDAPEGIDHLGQWLHSKFPEFGDQLVHKDYGREPANYGYAGPDLIPYSPVAKHRAYLIWKADPLLTSPGEDHGWSWSVAPRFDELEAFNHHGLAKARLGKNWGLLNRQGEWVLEPEFASIGNFPKKWSQPTASRLATVVAAESGLIGLVDSQGKLALPPEFSSIGKFSTYGTAKVTKSLPTNTESEITSLVGLIDATGRLLAKPEWEEVQDRIHGMIPVKKDGKWGYLDAAGKLAIPCEWDDAWRFGPGGCAVITKDKKRGFINRRGEVVAQPRWDGATNITREGLGMVRQGEYWALISSNGDMLTKPSFRMDYRGGFSWQERFFDWGMIRVMDRAGQPKLLGLDGKPHPDSDDILAVRPITGEGICLLWREHVDGTQSLLDSSGRELHRTSAGGSIVLSVKSLLGGLSLAYQASGEVMLQDESGNTLYSSSSDSGKGYQGKLSDGMSVSCYAAGYGYIRNRQREILSRFTLKGGAAKISNHCVLVEERNGKSGLINGKGEWIRPLSRGLLRNSIDGGIFVNVDGKWGCLNKMGESLVPPEWDELGPGFSEGLLAVRRGTKWGYVDGSGKVRVPVEAEEVRPFVEGHAAFKKNGKWGFANKDGEIVIVPAWVEVGDFGQGVVGVTSVQKQPRNNVNRSTNRRPWFFLDRHGKQVFEVAIDDWNLGTIGDPRFDHQNAVIRGAGPGRSGLQLWDSNGNVRSSWRDGPSGLPPGWSLATSPYRSDYWGRLQHFPNDTSRINLQASTGHPVLEDVSRATDFLDSHIPHAKPTKYGFINSEGETMVEPSWDGIEIISPEWVRFRVDDKYGLADQTGRVRVEPQWDSLRILSVYTAKLELNGETLRRAPTIHPGNTILSPWIQARSGDETVILTSEGARALPASLGDIVYQDFYGPDRLVFRREAPNGELTWVLYEPSTGKEVTFPKAKRLYWTWQSAALGLFMVSNLSEGDEEWRLMTDEGRDLGLTVFGFEGGWHFASDRILLRLREGWRVVTPEGGLLGEEYWEDARTFREGRAPVMKEGQWGYIDLEGKTIAEPIWKEVGEFQHGRAKVLRADGLWGFLDLDGDLIIEPIWDEVSDFTEWKVEGPMPSISQPQTVNSGWRKVFNGWHGASRHPSSPSAPRVRLIANARIDSSWAPINELGQLIADPVGITPGNSKPMEGLFCPERTWLVEDGSEVKIVERPKHLRDLYGRSVEIDYGVFLRWQGQQASYRGGSQWRLLDPEDHAVSTVWGRPWYDSTGDPFSGDLVPVRTPAAKYGLLRIGQSPEQENLLIAPEFDRIAWVAPGVAVAWNDESGGLLNEQGRWLFQDNDTMRISRFGRSADRSTPRSMRHGLVAIESSPKWGFAQLNRRPAPSKPE